MPEGDSENPLRTPEIEASRHVVSSPVLPESECVSVSCQAENVHKVYDTIASHWNHTLEHLGTRLRVLLVSVAGLIALRWRLSLRRYKAWPRVEAGFNQGRMAKAIAAGRRSFVACRGGRSLPIWDVVLTLVRHCVKHSESRMISSGDAAGNGKNLQPPQRSYCHQYSSMKVPTQASQWRLRPHVKEAGCFPVASVPLLSGGGTGCMFACHGSELSACDLEDISGPLAEIAAKDHESVTAPETRCLR